MCAHADTLEEAIARAYQQNPALEGNRELTRVADEGVVQAKAAYGPSLEISARHAYTTSRIRGTTLPSEEDGFATSGELSLSQALFTSGRLAAGVDAATARQLAAREGLRQATQQLILDVVTAYIGLQRDIALYNVAVENYGLLLQQRDVTASRFRLRDSTQPDLDQTSNRLELAAGRVIIARSTVDTSAARYRNLVGAYPQKLAWPPNLPAIQALEALYEAAEASNPQLASAKFVETSSRAAVGAARAAMRPQVSAFAAASRAPLTPYQNTLREEAVTAGVSLSMPLYTGGQQSSALREAIDRNLAAQQATEQARRDVRETLATDWSLLQASAEALPRYDAAVSAAEAAVQGVKQQETSGIRTLRDVLDVTNDLLAARTAAVQTRAETYIRQVAVLRDAGVLTIGMFAQVRPYDPDSRQPPLGRIAGLPLRPLVAPLDRLFLFEGVPSAPVVKEDSSVFDWRESTDDPLRPVAGMSSAATGIAR